MDSMEDPEKLVMRQAWSWFCQNFDEAIACINEEIYSQLLELCKWWSLNRGITLNMLTNELQVLCGQPSMVAYNMEFMESCFQLEVCLDWHNWDMLNESFPDKKFMRWSELTCKTLFMSHLCTLFLWRCVKNYVWSDDCTVRQKV
jgi:hypothetical protein